MITYPKQVMLLGNAVTLSTNEQMTALVVSSLDMAAKVVMGANTDLSEIVQCFQNGTLDFFPVPLCSGAGAINICKAGAPNDIIATALLGLVA